MKANLLILIICLGLGGTIAFLARENKPAPESQTEVETETSERTQKPVLEPVVETSSSDTDTTFEFKAPGGKQRPRVAVVVHGEDGNKLSPEEANRVMASFSKIRLRTAKSKSDLRLQLLEQTLNLSAEQSARLRARYDKNLKAIEEGNIGYQFDSPSEDELLSDLLTAEQRESLDQFEQRERSNQIESMANARLAELRNLDLSQEQRSAAYDAFYSQAEAQLDDPSFSPPMVADQFEPSIAEDASEDGVPDDEVVSGMTLSTSAQPLPAPQSDEGSSPEANLADLMETQRNREIEEKTELLKPILDPAQLDLYRSQLEAN